MTINIELDIDAEENLLITFVKVEKSNPIVISKNRFHSLLKLIEIEMGCKYSILDFVSYLQDVFCFDEEEK